MKLKSIKNICSVPLVFPGFFHLLESFIGRKFGGFICCWHNLSAERFQNHVETLHPAEPIPLEELVNRFRSGKSTKGCYALTFDDGIGSTVRDISKKCINKGWPVTFYVPTGYLDGEVLPYQKIEFINKYLPVDELHITIPISPYGLSKLGGEQFLHYLNKNCDMEIIVLRLPNVYGPRQRSDLEGGVVSIFNNKIKLIFFTKSKSD